MPNLDDTQPNLPQPAQAYRPGPNAPPKLLLWGVVGIFVLGIIGAVGGVLVFREALKPAQQERIISYFPFMESFLDRPDVGSTLPTAQAVDNDAANALLSAPLTANTPAPDSIATASPTAELTEDASLAVAANPTQPPTITPSPPPAQLSPTPLPSPTSEPIVVASNVNWQPSARNFGFNHQQQTWNNCGAANITMALSYYGWTLDQEYAGDLLKPEREDKNVSPHELVDFVNERSDLRALQRMGGTLDTLRALISNEFPVIVERGHMFEGYDWLGHYQTLVGYDDSQQVFVIYDSFLGAGVNGEGVFETYNQVDSGWREFNRTFIVVYDPAREQLLMDLLGDLADPQDAAMNAFTVAQADARLNPEDAFAWFNMGTSLTELARYQEAATAFDRAATIGLPWRMLWYQFGPLEAYYQVGRYDDVLTYVDSNLQNGGEYVEETYYWQGRAFAGQGRTAEARVAFRNALRGNSGYTAAQEALDALGV